MNDPINEDNFNFTEQREAQLTAYALGELDEHERALVERRLEHDADARAIVAQVRELATTLTAELAAEPMPRLSEPQREALRAENPARVNGVMKARTVPLRTRLWFGAGLAAAACVAIAVTMSSHEDFSARSTTERSKMVALGQPARDEASPGLRLDDKLARLPASGGVQYESMQSRSDEQTAPKMLAGIDAELNPAGGKGQTTAEFAGQSGALESKNEGLGVTLSSDGAIVNTNSASPEAMLSIAQSRQLIEEPPSQAQASQPSPSESTDLRAGKRIAVPGPVPAELSSTPGSPSVDADGDRGRIPGSRTKTDGGAQPTVPAAVDACSAGGVVAPIDQSAATSDSSTQYPADWPQLAMRRYQKGSVGAPPQPAENRHVPWHGDVPAFCPPIPGQPNTETYNRIVDNPFLAVAENPLSTFSIDVDTGSYANMRRFLLQNNTLPPPDAVRIEELINYFPLAAAAPGPESEHPFAVHVDMWEAPWSGDHHLARVTIKGREVKMDQRPATSLVFLIDVSGSMQPADKLPLLKQSMKMLVDQLHGDDRLAIVTYAGASGLVLPSTFASDKQRILGAIDNLNAGGSTNGAAGIQLAYQVAAESFIPGGVNRVILATDGDFNVGVSDDASLIRLIEEKRGTGVHLSVLGFGDGNLKDAKMEQLANHGNGEYAYIDSAREGRKVLVEQAAGTLITIAKDVKIQVEFNPAQVASYRLIGYENRVLAKEDFNNDAKDAGEIGAGHCVTALYEIVSANADVAGVAPVDALKYQKPAVQPTDAAKNSGELMTIKLRYKQPDGQVSKLIEMPVPDMRGRLGWVPDDMRFLTAVAEFGMLLRNSPYKGNASFAQVLDLAEGSRGEDAGGYRAEFIELVNRARGLRGQ